MPTRDQRQTLFAAVQLLKTGGVARSHRLEVWAHTDEDVGKWVDAFDEQAKELRAWSLTGYGASSR